MRIRLEAVSRLTLLSLALLVSFAAPSLAVKNNDLELEGNILGGDPPDPPAFDWANLFSAGSTTVPPSTVGPLGPLPSGGSFGPGTFVRDFVPGGTSDTTSFATGSKDTLNPTPGWQCKGVNNFGGKFDIVNAYAVPYTAPNGNVIIYFAMERHKSEGTSNVGFWFLQDRGVACNDLGGSADPFTGNHVDGDLFVVSEFTAGGTVSTIQVYRWQGGAGGSLNPTAIVSGADCKTAPASATVCATVNTATLSASANPTQIPWLTETSASGPTPSNDLAPNLFFEGGLNLTANNLVGCFSNFMAVTRSSSTLGSDMKDFARGNFNLCSISVSKTSECANFTSNSSGNLTFNNVVDVTISSQGAGTIPAGAITCHDNAGTGNPTGYDNPSQTGDDLSFVVPGALTGGNSVDWSDFEADPADRTFASSTNGPLNKVACIANLGGGVTLTGTAEVTTTACSASPDLFVDKTCEAALNHDDTAGRIVLEIQVGGQVCNTSDVPIVSVSVTDDKAGTLLSSGILDAGVLCDSDAGDPTFPSCSGVGGTCVGEDSGSGTPGVCRGTTDGTDGKFFGGAVCLDYSGSYFPDDTSSTSGETDPGEADFSDEVTATGSVDTDLGEIAVLPEEAAANCPLCPPAEVCEP